MKMITAIVSKKDASFVCDSLREANYAFTKMASTGGFLRAGNVTLLIGVEDERVADALELIRLHSAKRMEPAPYPIGDAGAPLSLPNEAQVPVGGATVFVTDIVHFEKF